MTAPHVLLVDDQKSNLEITQAVFEGAGAVTTAIQDPEEAFRMVKANMKSFDMVLIDIHMPKMDGQTLAKNLREAGYDRAIVAFTAHPTMKGKRAGEEHINHFLNKTTLKVDLVKAILDQYCS